MSYECQGCEKHFDSLENAHVAALKGCPNCGGTYITDTLDCGCDIHGSRIR